MSNRKQVLEAVALEPEVVEGSKACVILMAAGLIGAAMVAGQGMAPNFDATCMGEDCMWWRECSKK